MLPNDDLSASEEYPSIKTYNVAVREYETPIAKVHNNFSVVPFSTDTSQWFAPNQYGISR